MDDFDFNIRRAVLEARVSLAMRIIDLQQWALAALLPPDLPEPRRQVHEDLAAAQKGKLFAELSETILALSRLVEGQGVHMHVTHARLGWLVELQRRDGQTFVYEGSSLLQAFRRATGLEPQAGA